MDLVVDYIDEKINVFEIVLKLSVDLVGVCLSKVYVSKNTFEVI